MIIFATQAPVHHHFQLLLWTTKQNQSFHSDNMISDTKTLEAFERFQKKLTEVEDRIITLSMINDKNQVGPANVHFILVKVKLLARGFPVLNSVSN